MSFATGAFPGPGGAQSTGGGGGGGAGAVRGGGGRIVFADLETARRHLYVYAARAFQKEQSVVVNLLPDSYKSRWGTWCTLLDASNGTSNHHGSSSSTGGREGRPCYVLSPYDVPPGPHRTGWMEWFEQLRDFECDGMPHLICYHRTSAASDGDTDDDFVYELVAPERIADDGVRRQAAAATTTTSRLRAPALPPVVEFHDLVLRQESSGGGGSSSNRPPTMLLPNPPAASPLTVSTTGSGSASQASEEDNKVPDPELQVAVNDHEHEMLKRSGTEKVDDGFDEEDDDFEEVVDDGDDDDDYENDDDDDDSLFELESPSNKASGARKRRRSRGFGWSHSKRRGTTAKSNNDDEDGGDGKPTASAPGDQSESVEAELLPPDTEQVRSLLSQGYRRWRKPTLLPNGLYRRPQGRTFNGYEFDPISGLVKPISASGKASEAAAAAAEEEVLVPPDSDHVRQLLKSGYLRWQKPVLLPDGSYKKPKGRVRNGYEFDPVEGLIKPIIASTSSPVEATATSSVRDQDAAVPPPALSSNPSSEASEAVSAPALAESSLVREGHPQAPHQASGVAAGSRDLGAAKEHVLSILPVSYKAKFGMTGIDITNTSPVTIVSPFDPRLDRDVGKLWLEHLKVEKETMGLWSGSRLMYCVQRATVPGAETHERNAWGLLEPNAFAPLQQDPAPERVTSSGA